MIWMLLFLLLCPILVGASAWVYQRQASHVLLLGSLLYGVFSLCSLYLLALPAEQPMSPSVAMGRFAFGFHVDVLTASVLFVLGSVCWITFLTTPDLWTARHGILLFSLNAASLVLFFVSSNLLLSLAVLSSIDLAIVLGPTDTSVSEARRYMVLTVLHGSSSLVLGAATAVYLIYGTTNVQILAAASSELSPAVVTWLVAALFIGAAIKGAGFSFSFWAAITRKSCSELPHVSLVHGVMAILPGLYLLTRMSPLYSLSLIPVPIILGLATLLGFYLFPRLA